MSANKVVVLVQMGMVGGGVESFHIPRDTKVEEFQQMVRDRTGAVGVQLKMKGKSLLAKINGKVMTLADYKVRNRQLVFASLRLKGGATRFDVDEVQELGATVVCHPRNPNGPKGNCKFQMMIGDGCNESSVPKAKLDCGCIWCADCMRYYVKKQIEDNLAVKLTCGDSSHGKDLDIELAYAIAALTPEDRNKYDAKITETLCDRPDSSISICPSNKCKQFIFRENTKSAKVECGVCHKFMCWKCKREFKGKEDKDCGNDDCYDELCFALLLGEAKMKKIGSVQVTDTRICPNKKCCVVNVHDQGCKHMTCKFCKYQYCHICLQKWAGHQSSLCKVAPEQEITSDMKWQ